VTEGVGVRRFDRLTPVPHHREIGLFQPGDLGADIHQVHSRVQPPEQAVRGVEQAERLLIAAHSLVQNRQLPGCLCLTQHRPGADRQLHRGFETRLGQGVAAGLPVHPPDDFVCIGLVESRSQPVEDGERVLRVLPGQLVALSGEVDLRVVQEAQAL
jgi:hypothetical protein